MKKNIKNFNDMKKSGERVTWITAYDYPFAQAAEKAGVDMILVGDSGGMVQLGYETTNPVTMDEMILLTKAVRRGAPNTFIVGDMPQGSYEVSNEEAVRNAIRFIKETGCDAVKLEGGARVSDRIRAIANAGVLVIGHLGLTPQSAGVFGGYRVQGKTYEQFKELVANSFVIQESGACMLLLEAIPTIPAGAIARQLSIPVYGVGAGHDVDGQLVIMHDIMGFYQEFRPWFAKCYIPEVIDDFTNFVHNMSLDHGDVKTFGRKTRQDGLLTLAEFAIRKYVEEVKNKQFPGEEYSYPLKPEELEDLKRSIYI